jgi:hypothetical protein
MLFRQTSHLPNDHMGQYSKDCKISGNDKENRIPEKSKEFSTCQLIEF